MLSFNLSNSKINGIRLTFNFNLKEGGRSFLLIRAKVSKIFAPSSNRPLARSQRGDSGRNLI